MGQMFKPNKRSALTIGFSYLPLIPPPHNVSICVGLCKYMHWVLQTPARGIGGMRGCQGDTYIYIKVAGKEIKLL